MIRRHVATCRAILRFQYNRDQIADAIQPAIAQKDAPTPTWIHADHLGDTSPVSRPSPTLKLANNPIGRNAAFGVRPGVAVLMPGSLAEYAARASTEVKRGMAPGEGNEANVPSRARTAEVIQIFDTGMPRWCVLCIHLEKPLRKDQPGRVLGMEDER